VKLLLGKTFRTILRKKPSV